MALKEFVSRWRLLELCDPNSKRLLASQVKQKYIFFLEDLVFISIIYLAFISIVYLTY